MSNSNASSLALPIPALARHYSRSPRVDLTVSRDTWQPEEASLYVWIYFNLISNTIFLPVLVATILFSKHARGRRPPLLINTCLVWILSGIFSLLLFYDGTARPNDPAPSFALCTTQLSLLYGILPMWSVAVLVFTYHVYVAASGFPRGKTIPVPLLLAAPYIVQIGFTTAGLVAVMTSNFQVERSFFFCTLAEHPLSNATSIFVFVVCLGIVLLKIQLACTCYRNWRALRSARLDRAVPSQIPVVRVLIFGVYVFVGMVCNLIRLFNPKNLMPYLYVATAGLAVFLVFGTQSHILEAWSFWKWRKSRLHTDANSPALPTVNPFLTSDEGIRPPTPNWRDTSLLSPVVQIGSINTTPEIQEVCTDAPPTPLPRAQIVQRFHTDRELGGGLDRRSKSIHFSTPVISITPHHRARSNVV